MPTKKPHKSTATKLELELGKELKILTKEITKLKDLEFIQVLKHPWRLMGLSLLKGIMIGFGSVLGATVLVALFVYLLSQISLVPVVGDFVKEIIQEIQMGNGAQ
ncbi:MAG: DUF5665 domain-containing protein [Candidatus Gracilibacteria bacterium]|nr:DUF5665 domain-containing protein [Candidatus Gracilibacteria bacterium]